MNAKLTASRLVLPALCAFATVSASGKTLVSYQDTNQLVWDKTFTSSVTRLFGKRHASYFWLNGLISEQVLAGLGGRPDAIRPVGKSALFIASACRQHSCEEKVAVVLQDTAHLVAFGLIHYSCVEDFANVDCANRPMLSILSKGRPVDPKVREALVEWSTEQVGEFTAIKTQVVR